MAKDILCKIQRALVCAAAIGASSMLLASSASAQNLITDPSFEAGTTAPNPNPNGTPGWATFGGAGGVVDASARTGTHDMFMNGAPGGYFVPGAYEALAATGGQTYKLSGWVFTPNALVTGSNDFAILQISFFDGAPPSNYAGGNTLSTVGVDVGTPGGTPPASTVTLPQGVWTFASVSGTAPAGTNSLGAYLLNINADSNAVFAFDDISLTVPEPASLSMLGIAGLAAMRRRRV